MTMIPFVGPSYKLQLLNADCQRVVNMYPVANEVGGGATGVYLESIPGLDVFSAVPAPPGFGIGWMSPPQDNNDPLTATVTEEGFDNFTGSSSEIRMNCTIVPYPPDEHAVEFVLDSWTPVNPGDPAPQFNPSFDLLEIIPKQNPDSNQMLDGVAHIKAIVDGVPADGYLILTMYHNDDTGGYGGLSWEHS
jgi:hypothetical protein